jgi:hypothetical protein
MWKDSHFKRGKKRQARERSFEWEYYCQGHEPAFLSWRTKMKAHKGFFTGFAGKE